MQLSLANLMFLPFALIVAPMIITSATYIGLAGAHHVFPENWYTARWMIELGVPSDIATRHLVFFVWRVPTIAVLVILGIGLFLLRNRYADQFAMIPLLAIPFVDAYSVSTSMVEFPGLLHEQSFSFLGRAQFASEYLRTQLLTATVLMLIVSIFILGRYRMGYAPQTPRHTTFVSACLAVLTVGSWTLWSMS